jgi:hypothetical protein
MYRSYEDPEALKKRLEEVQTQFKATNDFEDKIKLYDDIQDLKARINYAYQDIEADILSL